jgi:hypothetical protein
MSDEVSNMLKQWKEQSEQRARAGRALLEGIWPRLASAGIEEVQVKYYGSGDSGGFEDLSIKIGEETRNHSIPWNNGPYEWDDLNLGKIVTQRFSGAYYPEIGFKNEVVEEELDLMRAIVSVAEAALEMHHGGWENNDGGQGYFELDVEARTASLHHTEFYTETRDFTHNFPIFDGEE